MRITVPQEGLKGGEKTVHPNAATRMADGAVEAMPPRDMPTKSAVTGAGETR